MLNLQVEETSTCMGDMKMPKGPQGQRRPADVIGNAPAPKKRDPYKKRSD